MGLGSALRISESEEGLWGLGHCRESFRRPAGFEECYAKVVGHLGRFGSIAPSGECLTRRLKTSQCLLNLAIAVGFQSLLLKSLRLLACRIRR